MKQKIVSIAKILMVIAALAITVSYAYAWSVPGGTFPAGNVPAPVNTGNIDQTKNANLGVTKSFFAGIDVAATNMVMGLKGVFGCNGWSCYLANTSGQSNGNALSAGTFNSGGLFTAGLSVSPAGKVAIVDGTQGANKVFTSDANGVGSWANAPTVPDINTVTTTSDGLITYVRTSPQTGFAQALCPSNTILISGGGQCQYGIRYSQPIVATPNDVHGQVNDAFGNARSFNAYSGSDPAIGWGVVCLNNLAAGGGGRLVGVANNVNTGQGTASAEAICLKKTPLVTNVGVNGAPNGGSVTPPNNGGGGTNPTWQNATYSDGNLGETCAAWLTRSGFAAQFTSQIGYNGNMRATGTQIINGTSLPAAGGQGTCAYKGVVNGTTYCATGWADNNFSLSGSVITNHSQLRPTASCSGKDVNNSAIQLNVITQIYQ